MGIYIRFRRSGVPKNVLVWVISKFQMLKKHAEKLDLYIYCLNIILRIKTIMIHGFQNKQRNITICKCCIFFIYFHVFISVGAK